MNRRAIISTISVPVACAVMLLYAFPAHAQGCSVTGNAQSPNRYITTIVDCPGAAWFKLSESADFRETNGGRVEVAIDAVAADKTYADISVTYPNGTTGGNGIPFYVQPARKTIRILAVRYIFEDEEGKTSGMPAYATDTWLKTIVFGSTVGFDAQPTANSIQAYTRQNTYDRVAIEGETYPDIIRLPLKEYFDPFDLYPNTPAPEAIIGYIITHNPQFFDGKQFDFLVGFSPDRYTVEGSLEGLSPTFTTTLHPSLRGYINSVIPITHSSLFANPIINEPAKPQTLQTVSTKYDPQTVSGVWLASDPDHLGTNYFSGGQVVGARGHRYIQLGTALPDAATPVMVSYTASRASIIDEEKERLFPPDSLIISGSWYPRYLHELYHVLSSHISFNGALLGDLYREPDRFERYDLMDKGLDNSVWIDPLGIGHTLPYHEPAHLSGYSKMESELLFPYVLEYGKNEHRLRIYKTEEDDFRGTDQRTKLVKIPLRPPGEPAFQRMVGTIPSRQYSGEEYLLLEWRYKGALTHMRNFDAYLPAGGLLVTHVIEDGTLFGTNYIGHGYSIARIIDSTPPGNQEEGYTDTEGSFVPFGPDSGVYAFRMADPWQQIVADRVTADFFLSEGIGTKTIHAKFKNAEGTLLGSSQFFTQSSDASTVQDRVPVMTITNPAANSVITTDPTRVTMTVASHNTIVRTFTYYDGKDKGDVTGAVTVDFIRNSIFPEPGFHRMRYVAFDYAGNRAEAILPFFMGSKPASNQLPVAMAGDDRVIDAGDVPAATVVLDGRGSRDTDGMISTYEWLEKGTVIARSAVLPLRRGAGVHAFTLRVTDNLGAEATDEVILTVHSTGATPTAPRPVLGDANGDNRVDETDYALFFLPNYSKTIAGGASVGDFNADSTVDGRDYVVWLVHFGT